MSQNALCFPRLNTYPAGKDSTQQRAVLSGNLNISGAVGVAVSAYTIASNVITLTTATNNYTAGQTIVLTSFGTSTFLNGARLVVLSTGLSTTNVAAAFIHADVGATSEAGISLVPAPPIAISAWSITSNVVTFTTSAQTLITGQTFTLSGFGTSTFFNGVTLTALSTGLGSTQVEANFTHANGSATEAGFLTAGPIYVTGGVVLANNLLQWPVQTNSGASEIMPSQNPVPLLGSVVLQSVSGANSAGTAYDYRYDYLTGYVRIFAGATEIANAALVSADSVLFTAEFARAL